MSYLYRSRTRYVWFGIVLMLLVAGAVYSLQRYRNRYQRWSVTSQRELTLRAMHARPNDYWPRGDGHVVFAWPGSRRDEKSYHEPGGSFSPTPGSFGVAIGVADTEGHLTATGDSMPLADIRQSLESTTVDAPPQLVDSTPYYRSSWQSEKPGEWRLAATPDPNRAPELVLLVRSAGPAGGPLTQLRFQGNDLVVNGRFTLRFEPAPSTRSIGEEPNRSMVGWLNRSPSNAPTERRSDHGWLYARLGWSPARAVEATITDSLPHTDAGLRGLDAHPVSTKLGASEFESSIAAQVAHLRMSLVGTETRPGEPTNYPLEWLRDGAYVVVALARAGHVELAKRLTLRFAERDFFGGFGPEGDNPAFALWVLDEVSTAANDPNFEQELYPHVARKAHFIERMLDTREPIHVLPLPSPIVPSWLESSKRRLPLSLVCDSSRDGLIIGRMDGHFPLLFVNAVNYLGLLRAARLVRRAGNAAWAGELRRRADELRIAWQRAFRGAERANERTAIAGLWPTFVAARDLPGYRALLQQRNEQRGQTNGALEWPNQWSYFDVAEMHQWLELGEPVLLWKELRDYYSHQSSPGLYTWGEGSGEENAYGLWKDIRGWVTPHQVTPHYWTAAEMLLLQLEMLAYVDESNEDAPRWVLGAGVQPDWLVRPLAVERVGTSRGRVSWQWDPGNKTLHANVTGQVAPVSLGRAFPTETRLQVSFESTVNPNQGGSQ